MNGAGAAAGGAGRTVLDCSMHKLPSSRRYYQVRLVVPDSGIPYINYQQVAGLVRTRKPLKTIQFVDLLFADKKHDTEEKFAFSIYSIDKTITFLAQDETMMNEWLTKIRELHSDLYPEFKRYDSIFEANLQDKLLARTMRIQGHYRLALCKESIDLIPLLTLQDQQQNNPSNNTNSNNNNHINSLKTIIPTTLASTITTSISHNNNNHTPLDTNLNHPHPHHHHHHHQSTGGNFTYLQNQHLTPAANTITSPRDHHHHPHHHHHHHLPQHLPSHQRFCKRHPLLASKTIELVWRNIRRCGHTESFFYIELGRQSQIGEGGLWMSMNKKSTARQLHELSLAAMKQASTTEDPFLYRAPRSRSGSSSDNAHRSQQSRSSSLVCLNSELPNNQQHQLHSINNNTLASAIVASATMNNAAIAMFPNHDNKNMEEDEGYLPMA